MPEFDESGLSEMSRYNWPGNVRELRNIVERAVLLFPGKTVTGKDVRNNLLRLTLIVRARFPIQPIIKSGLPILMRLTYAGTCAILRWCLLKQHLKRQMALLAALPKP